MEGFQKIVLISAIIILIIALVVIGIALSSATNNEDWPPMVPDCPDYWKIDGSGNMTTCTNIKDLGVCRAKSGQKHQVMNFNSPAFTGDNGTCNKYNWAKRCQVTWDGITYGAENPCNK
jgi:hypothetical protein